MAANSLEAESVLVPPRVQKLPITHPSKSEQSELLRWHLCNYAFKCAFCKVYLVLLMSKNPQEFDSAFLESALKGKTLLIYWYLLQQPSHSVGVREVQRALGLSSPSIAVHHLEKLQDLGLITKKGTGEYVLEGEVKVGILRFFTRIGRFLVPRYLFYSVLFTTMLTTYLALCFLGQISLSFYALMFSLIAVIIFWIEAIRLWRARPF